jgi:hypothetical protein
MKCCSTSQHSPSTPEKNQTKTKNEEKKERLIIPIFKFLLKIKSPAI